MELIQLGMLGVDSVRFEVPGPLFSAEAEGWKRVGRFLHLGGGVQSSALVYMMLEEDVEPFDAVLFADTGDEPVWVYEQVAYLGELLAARGVPLHIVRREGEEGRGMIEAIRAAGGGRFASMPLYTQNPDGSTGQMRRQCTNEWKIEPLKGFILEWLIERGHARRFSDKNGRDFRRVNRGIYIEDVYGISLDEVERAGARGARWQQATYPLLDDLMRRQDCIQYAIQHGYRVPLKSSCRTCPFHSDDTWLMMKRDAPADFEAACEFDDWLRSEEASQRFTDGMRGDVFLHRTCQPLREIDFEGLLALGTAAPLLDLCGGHCHV